MDKIGWGFFLESRIFLSSKKSSFPSREFLPRVENILIESRLFSSSPDFFAGSRIFSSSREYPTCHVVICHQNDQTIRRSAICWLRSFFIHRFCSSGCWRTCCGGLGEVSVVYTGLYFPYRTLHNFRKRQKYGIYTRSLGRLCWNNRSVFFGSCQRPKLFRDKSADWRPFSLLAGATKPCTSGIKLLPLFKSVLSFVVYLPAKEVH